MIARVLAVTVAVSMAQAGIASTDPVADMPPPSVTLPTPGGQLPVGTTMLHLVEQGTPDPFLAGDRELMVSVFYPAGDVTAHPRVPAVPDDVRAAVEQRFGLRALGIKVPVPASNSYLDAPAAAGSYPVVLYSPGQGGVRELGTGTAEELASRGYVVVTIDHTDDSMFVGFPDGRMVAKNPGRGQLPKPQRIQIRVDDAEYVLDSLAAAQSGADPDADQRPLPEGLGAALDLARVGVFGHSLGGSMASELAAQDPRIGAAIDMDGGFDVAEGSDWMRAGTNGVPQPMLVVRHSEGRATGGSEPFYNALLDDAHGWKQEIEIEGTQHEDLSGMPQLVPFPLPSIIGQYMPGPLPPARVDTAIRTTVVAFFDKFLRGADHTALDDPAGIPDTKVVR